MTEQDPEKPDFSNVVSSRPASAPEPARAPEREAQRTLRLYQVEKGDNLSKISRKFYGDGESWRRIFEANRDVIEDADRIQPGWKIRIPE